MSLAAFLWAKDLPLNAVTATSYRVLVHLCDDADSAGRNAWARTTDLAGYLVCHPRTIERAFRELRQAGLIREGDQRAVAHVRADRRPRVYDLALDWTPELSR